MNKTSYIAVFFLLVISSKANCQVISIDPCCTPGSFNDLGNIASNGSGGRQPVVRALEEGESSGYTFFETFLSGEGRFADPPATPSQEILVLLAGDPLALALPQLSHFPSGATVSVEHIIIGNQIEVEAQIHYLGYATDWLAPPHEYVHALSAFIPGDYRLTLNLSRSDWMHPDEPSVSRGVIDFTVVAIPEPSTSAVALVAAILACSVRWFRAF